MASPAARATVSRVLTLPVYGPEMPFGRAESPPTQGVMVLGIYLASTAISHCANVATSVRN
jgi:hypothetical protein